MANRVQGNKNAKFRNAKNKKITGGIKKKVVKARVQDARQKIIQKKRTTVVDARDVLAKMAKTKDARSKLNKIRENQPGRSRANENVKVIGGHIVQKTDRNGKISLTTNKPKPKSDMNMTIRKQLGLVAQGRVSPKKSPVKRHVAQKANPPLHIKKTIMNNIDLAPLNARLQRMERLYDSGLYKWTNPDIRTASQMIGSLDPHRHIATSNILTNGWPEYPIMAKKPGRLLQTSYIDLDAVDDEEMPLMPPLRQPIALQGTSRLSNIHSRLDSHPIPTETTHGILGQTKTKVVVPAGHRIVVSNLQSTVSQDDIKELFEDIGQLLAARLVRPGVAEVIYRSLKDAQKAVDTYHNRQLDGQPMKCLLVNKRPLNHPTAPALSKTDSQGTAARSALESSDSAKLVPDINTIHKVLFQRK